MRRWPLPQPPGNAMERAAKQGGTEMQGKTDLEGHIEETRRLCGSLTHMLHKDAQCVHMAFHHTSGVDAGNTNRSTVGIMLSGTRIDSILPGGPAQGSPVNKGDIIIAVDDQAATSDNVSTLLVGNDDPGVDVILTIKNSAGSEMDVHITRMATAKIADRRRIFDLFAAIKDRVLKKTDRRESGGWFGSTDPDSGKSSAGLVDEAVELWSRMLEADHLVQQNVLHEVGRLQRDGSQHAAGLVEVVDKMALMFSHQVAARETVSSTPQDTARIAELEREMTTLREKLAEAHEAAHDSGSKLTTAQHAASESAAALKDLEKTAREADGVARGLRQQLAAGEVAAAASAEAIAQLHRELEAARADGVKALSDVPAAYAELERRSKEVADALAAEVAALKTAAGAAGEAMAHVKRELEVVRVDGGRALAELQWALDAANTALGESEAARMHDLEDARGKGAGVGERLADGERHAEEVERMREEAEKARIDVEEMRGKLAVAERGRKVLEEERRKEVDEVRGELAASKARAAEVLAMANADLARVRIGLADASAGEERAMTTAEEQQLALAQTREDEVALNTAEEERGALEHTRARVAEVMKLAADLEDERAQRTAGAEEVAALKLQLSDVQTRLAKSSSILEAFSQEMLALEDAKPALEMKLEEALGDLAEKETQRVEAGVELARVGGELKEERERSASTDEALGASKARVEEGLARVDALLAELSAAQQHTGFDRSSEAAHAEQLVAMQTSMDLQRSSSEAGTAKIRVELEEARTELAASKASVVEVREVVAALEESILDVRGSSEETIVGLRGEVETLTQRLQYESAAHETAKNAWEEALVEVRELEQGLGEVRGSLGATIQGLEVEVARLTADRSSEDQQLTIAELEGEVGLLQAAAQEQLVLAGQPAPGEMDQGLLGKVAALEDQVAAIQAEHTDTSERLSAKTAAAERLEMEVATLQGAVATRTGELEAARGELAEVGEQVREGARVAAMQGSVDQARSSSEAEMVRVLEERLAAGEVTVAALAAMDQERSSSDEETAKMRAELEEVRKELEASKATVVELKAAAEHAIQGGVRDTLDSEQTISFLQGEVVRLKTELAERVSNAETDSASPGLQKQLDPQNDQAARRLENGESLSRRLVEEQRRGDDLQVALNAADRQLSDASQAHRLRTAELDASTKHIQELVGKAVENGGELERVRGELGELQDKHFGRLEDEGEARREAETLRSERIGLQVSLVHLDGEVTDLRQRLSASHGEGAAAKGDVVRLEGELAAQAVKTDEWFGEAAELQQKLSDEFRRAAAEVAQVREEMGAELEGVRGGIGGSKASVLAGVAAAVERLTAEASSEADAPKQLAMAALQGEVARLQAALAEDVSNGESEGSPARPQKQIEFLKEDVARLLEHGKMLSRSFAVEKDRADVLEHDAQSLMEALAAQEANVAAEKERAGAVVAELAAEREKVKAGADRLAAMQGSMDQERSIQGGVRDASEHTIAALQGEVDRLQGEVERLEAEVAESVSKLETESVEWTVELERRLGEISGWSSETRGRLEREREERVLAGAGAAREGTGDAN